MNPNQANELFQKGMQAGQQGRLEQAEEFFMAAAAESPADAVFLIKVGQILENMQKPANAEEVYRKVLQIEMNNVEAYLGMGRTLAQVGAYKLAKLSLEQANKLQPGNKETLARLSRIYWALKEDEKAVKAITEAKDLGIAPEFYFNYLANFYEKTSNLEKLGPLLEEGLKILPDNPPLLAISGEYYNRVGKTEKALENLLSALGKTNNPSTNLRIHFELGQVYSKLGNYQKAFENFTLGNQISEAVTKKSQPNMVKGREFIKNVDGVDFSGWGEKTAETLKEPGYNPIFLVGFPRSGTTLLNRILDSHKMIECVEEETILYGVKKTAMTKYNGYFDVLNDLSTAQLNELRDQYFEGTKEYKTTGTDIFMVDKFPLCITEIPFIKKIFPGSKIILALRHPCDCTLSCFMQNFGLNQAMLNFINLDDATSYYVEIMKQWVLFCDALDFDYYPLIYEKLVTKTEPEIRNLVSYLGLEWDPGIMDFTKKAAEQGRIKTPSYRQVVKPIYQDAKDRWRNYEENLAPYYDRLKPYCDFFGYKI